MVGVGSPTGARADEQEAKRLFKAMSDYLATEKTMSFSYDSNLEIVTKDKQKIALASSGTVTLERPDKARITRRGGFADIESVFDGKTLTLLGKNANLYAQVKETLKKSENAPMARCKSLIFLDPESAKRNFSVFP